MFTTFVRRDGSVYLGSYAELFRPDDVVNVSVTSTGAILLVRSDEPAALELAMEMGKDNILENLFERINAEETRELQLFAAHYLRWLRKLTPKTPTRAAYQIPMADAKRVRAYIEVAWEEMKHGDQKNPRLVEPSGQGRT
jgi:hypothetical protein